MLTKQAFLDQKIQVKKIEVPEWNDFVYIKKMSAGERSILITSNEDNKGMDSVVKTLQLIICDENGIRIFDNSEEDFNLLNSKDGTVLENIFNEALYFNGLGAEPEKQAIKN
jgi:hypothetical protein